MHAVRRWALSLPLSFSPLSYFTGSHVSHPFSSPLLILSIKESQTSGFMTASQFGPCQNLAGWRGFKVFYGISALLANVQSQKERRNYKWQTDILSWIFLHAWVNRWSWLFRGQRSASYETLDPQKQLILRIIWPTYSVYAHYSTALLHVGKQRELLDEYVVCKLQLSGIVKKKKKTVSSLKYWRCTSYYNFLCRGKRKMTTWLLHFICTDFKLK